MSSSDSSVEFRVSVAVEPVVAPVSAPGPVPAPVPAQVGSSGSGSMPKAEMSEACAAAGAEAQGVSASKKRAMACAASAAGADDTPIVNKKQKSSSGSDVVILEKGRIFFAYRPKVHPADAPTEVHTLNDIQKTEILLCPLEAKDLEQRKTEQEIGAPGARAQQHEQHMRETSRKTETAANGSGAEAGSAEVAQQTDVANGSRDHEGPVTKHQTETMLKVHFPNRLIRIPKKVVPRAVGDFARPNFAYVEMVSDSLHDLDVDLSTHTYDTATRGTREQPAARLVASGVYEILRHSTPYNVETPTTLVWALSQPETMGPAQHVLGIEKQGSVMIQVRNPHVGPSTQGGFAGLPAEQKPQYPKPLMELFAGVRVAERRFIPLDPPDFLNHRFCELLLMPVKNCTNIVNEWGAIGEELVKESEQDSHETGPSSSPVAKIARELELGPKTDVDVNPLVTGKLE